MARKPRQRQEREGKSIEIHRNIIEQSLMDTKDFIKNNKKLTMYSLITLLGAVLIAIAALIAVDHVNSVNEQRFDEIMDRLAKIKGPAEEDSMNKVIADLKKHVDSTYFGFSHNAAHYVLGNIYYDRRNWSEAKQNLLAYADKENTNLLAPIALLKAALCLEEAHDLKGAIGVYRRLEEKYADSVVADQVFYNYARVCALNGDMVNARNYYNKVLSTFPDSGYSQQAKKRLFMLGAN
jgi:tetratricopeptide (TPR) repeat protein